MMQLSRAELFELIEELKNLGKGTQQDDDVLIRETSAVIEAWQPILGFSEVLLRHVAAICGYLREGLEGDSRNRARGVLALISRELSKEGDSRSLEGQVLAFIAGVVANELRQLKHAQVSYRPFELSDETRQMAEDILLRFYEQPKHSDEELLALCRDFADHHDNLSGSNFFGRLILNLSNLEEMFRAKETEPEHRKWIRAALAYIVEAEDAIDDRLGLLGLLDDAFVAALVTSIVRPGMPPWTKILDQLYGEWPFVDEVVLHGEHTGRPMTEFLAINAALACRDLQNDPGRPLVLILPEVGPMPLLLGAFSAIGLLQDWLRSSGSPLQFEVGQTVRLDNRASAQYMGTRTFEGKEFIALRFWNRRGKEETAHFPLSERPRLTPGKPEKRPRGPIDQTAKGKSHLSAIEHLFHLNRPRALSSLSKKILLLAPIGRTREFASEIHLCGLPLHSALPMAHRKKSKEVEAWDKKYAALPPVLEIVPSLQEALRQTTEDPQGISLIIVDLRGTNAGRIAELDELLHANVPLVLITEEHEERTVEFLQGAAVGHWLWTPEDLKSLVWPRSNTQPSAVGRYEERMQLGATADIQPVPIEDPLVESVFKRLRALRRTQASYASEDDDVPEDLDQVVEAAERLTFSLFRLDSAYGNQGTQEKCQGELDKLLEIGELTEDERDELRLFLEDFRAALEDQQLTKPRRLAILELLTQHPDAQLLVRDEREREAILESTTLEPMRVLIAAGLPLESVQKQLVISGWFGKKRMARLLAPPVASSIWLIINQTERQWFERFRQRQVDLRQELTHRSKREHLFSNLEWQTQQVAVQPVGSRLPGKGVEHRPEDRDDFYGERRVNAFARARWDHQDESRCNAHLLLFEGHSVAWLTSKFKVPTISFRYGQAASCDVRRRVSDLRSGDPIFLATQEFDSVIEELSGHNLPQGVLEQARLWHRALKKFLEREFPGEPQETGLLELQRRLADEGCKRHLATIRAWVRSTATIAPQNPEEALAAIARATGDLALAEQLSECLHATETVYRAQAAVRRGLRREAFDALRTALDQGAESWRTLDFRGVYRVVWIADIDQETQQVPRALTNKIIWEV